MNIFQFKKKLLSKIPGRNGLGIDDWALADRINEALRKIATITEPRTLTTRDIEGVDVYRQIEDGLWIRRPRKIELPVDESGYWMLHDAEVKGSFKVTSESVLKIDKHAQDLQIELPYDPGQSYILASFPPRDDGRDYRVAFTNVGPEKDTTKYKLEHGLFVFKKIGTYWHKDFSQEQESAMALFHKTVKDKQTLGGRDIRIDIDEDLLDAVAYYIAAALDPLNGKIHMALFYDNVNSYSRTLMETEMSQLGDDDDENYRMFP